VGKTTYFAVLKQALEDRGWLAQVYPSGNESSSEQQGELHRALIDEIHFDIGRGYFPRKTRLQPQSDDLFFGITKEGRSMHLTFYDPAGELFELLPNEEKYRAEARNQIFDHMKDCTGILVLFDFRKSAQELRESWSLSIGKFIQFLRDRQLDQSVLASGALRMRTAVLFTKVDRLPWFSRHRPREADAWLEKDAGLRALAEEIRRGCTQVKFFFCSAVGWNRGRPNCRTAVRPRKLAIDKVYSRADLIPDPLSSSQNLPGSSPRLEEPALPLFVDPLQLVDEAEVDWQSTSVEAGVFCMPGRKSPATDHDKFPTPWNVLEPLLWAADVENP
jgi:hypothetical protein